MLYLACLQGFTHFYAKIKATQPHFPLRQAAAGAVSVERELAGFA
jgi:hypothetical protein